MHDLHIGRALAKLLLEEVLKHIQAGHHGAPTLPESNPRAASAQTPNLVRESKRYEERKTRAKG